MISYSESDDGSMMFNETKEFEVTDFIGSTNYYPEVCFDHESVIKGYHGLKEYQLNNDRNRAQGFAYM